MRTKSFVRLMIFLLPILLVTACKVTPTPVFIEPEPTPIPLDTETPTPAPTATPMPEPTPTATLAPVDMTCMAAAYGEDATIPEGTNLGYGEVFTKTWHIQNSGTCAWPDDTALVWVDYTRLGEVDEVIVGAVPVGERTAITVTLQAPEEEGSWWSGWELQIRGAAIPGGRLGVTISTGNPATILEGTVLWANEPLPNVTVAIGKDVNNPTITVSTGDQGHFSVENPPVGQLDFWAQAPSEDFAGSVIVHNVLEHFENEVTITMTKLAWTGISFAAPTGPTPTLTWEPFPGVTEYCFMLYSQTPEFEVFDQGCTPDTSWTVMRDLSSGKEYCWTVQGYADGTNTVTIAAPDASCFTVE